MTEHGQPRAALFASVCAEDQEHLARELAGGKGATALVVWFRLSLEAFKAQSCKVAVPLSRLTYDGGITKQTVVDRLVDLERLGFISVTRQRSPQQGNLPTLYRLLRGPYAGLPARKACPLSRIQTRLPEIQPPLSRFPDAATEGDLSPLPNTPQHQPKNSLSADAAEAIYREYPRKVGKQAALRAIRAALRQVSEDVLLGTVREYAAAMAGCDPQFIPHPATWFNAGRWEDDPREWQRVPRDSQCASPEKRGTDSLLLEVSP